MGPTAGDLYEAFYAQIENGDRIFEFWITVTFAVIIATFIAGARITKPLFALVCSLYLIVCINLFLRHIQAFSKFEDIRNQLIGAGEALPNQDINVAIGALTILTYIGGTVGTLYFVWRTYTDSDKATGNDV